MIELSGYIDVPAHRLDALRAALPEHIRLSRAEPGCLCFTVTPCPDVPGRLLVHETFKTREHFDTHQARLQTSDWGRLAAGLTRDYAITQLPD